MVVYEFIKDFFSKWMIQHERPKNQQTRVLFTLISIPSPKKAGVRWCNMPSGACWTMWKAKETWT